MWIFLAHAPASAGTECMTVDAFDTWMDTHPATTDVTLTFDVTGVNPNDFFGTKGALADLTDTACAGGGSLALKVYGPDDPPNEVHGPGTLKHEYGYNCGPSPYTETWADPNPSVQVFFDGTERCDVTVWLNPATFGYRLDCDHGTFEATGANTMGMPVDHITLFALTNPDTWHIDAALSTWNEVCFATDDAAPVEPSEPTDGVYPAIEDVTVAIDSPTTVYPDATDLCVEAGYCEAWVKFDLSAVPGTIVSATLDIAAWSDGSANGSGVEVWGSPDTGWSAATLAWDQRPAPSGVAVGRAGPIVPDGTYTFDVSSLVSAPGLYSFGLRPGPNDTDGAHFHAVESDAALAPRLTVTWVPDSTTPEDGTSPEQPVDAEDPELPAAPVPQLGSGCACGHRSGPAAGWLLGLAALAAVRSRSPAAGSAGPTP